MGPSSERRVLGRAHSWPPATLPRSHSAVTHLLLLSWRHPSCPLSRSARQPPYVEQRDARTMMHSHKQDNPLDEMTKREWDGGDMSPGRDGNMMRLSFHCIDLMMSTQPWRRLEERFTSYKQHLPEQLERIFIAPPPPIEPSKTKKKKQKKTAYVRVPRGLRRVHLAVKGIQRFNVLIHREELDVRVLPAPRFPRLR